MCVLESQQRWLLGRRIGKEHTQVAQDPGEERLGSGASDGPEGGGGPQIREPLGAEADQDVEEDKEGEGIWAWF